MNKAELVATIADGMSVPKKDAEKFIDLFTSTVTSTLAKGEKVQIIGFGSFEVTERAARKARNLHTGEEFDIPATKAPKFKAGKGLKDAVKS